MVTTLAGVISSTTPAPELSLPRILLVAETFCIFAYVTASSAMLAVATPPLGTRPAFPCDIAEVYVMSDVRAIVPVDEGRVRVAEPLVSVPSAFILTVSDPLSSTLNPLSVRFLPRN